MSFNEYDKINKVLNLVAGGTLFADMPIGTIIVYGGATAPKGFLLCEGQNVSRTTYADLFKVIGTSFGPGDGSTTFTLPSNTSTSPKKDMIKAIQTPIPADLEAQLQETLDEKDLITWS